MLPVSSKIKLKFSIFFFLSSRVLRSKAGSVTEVGGIFDEEILGGTWSFEIEGGGGGGIRVFEAGGGGGCIGVFEAGESGGEVEDGGGGGVKGGGGGSGSFLRRGWLRRWKRGWSRRWSRSNWFRTRSLGFGMEGMANVYMARICKQPFIFITDFKNFVFDVMD